MSDERKKDHIALAFKSVPKTRLDLGELRYEPLFDPHPMRSSAAVKFMGQNFGMPLWVSSMTGGTARAKVINENLAKACNEFNLGMGLGSCRPLLESAERFSDFDLREIIGSRPFYTNFGIAQIEELVDCNKINKLLDVNKSLQADGMIIHINPLQEMAQPEGDRYKRSPLESIKTVLDKVDVGVIIKEVGQGFGPKSLKSLMELPLKAIEFGAFGGTNFTILEHTRHKLQDSGKTPPKHAFGHIGHTPEEMIGWINELQNPNGIEFIISGGITDPITGHKLMHSLSRNSIVGMASELLHYSMGDYEELQKYLTELQEAFALAKTYIKGE